MPRRIFILFAISFAQYGYAQNLDSTNVSSLTKQKTSSYIAPAIFIGYGAVSLLGNNFIRKLDFTTNAELREDHPIFSVKLDNYLQYSPLVAVYGLDLLGVKAKIRC